MDNGLRTAVLGRQAQGLGRESVIALRSLPSNCLLRRYG
jgi:hypothetical protein